MFGRFDSFDFLLHDGLNKSIAVVTVHMHSNHCYTFYSVTFSHAMKMKSRKPSYSAALYILYISSS